MIPSNFYVCHDKFQELSNKATDWFIESWDLKEIDKEIALLYRKKYHKEALEYLKKAVKYLV